MSNGLTLWQHLEVQAKQLEDMDKEIVQDAKIRNEKEDELTKLRRFAEEINRLKEKRIAIDKIAITAQEGINEFNTNNEQLISAVENERPIVAENQLIAKAYATFVQKLTDYMNSLPAKLVADLGDTIVQLYNAFNRHDAEYEQLAEVHLPLQQNQRIEIAFVTQPDTFFDALHILSEGHIRCLGLAILSAKNIKEGCPFLIFDDPVNAIDDEHRESIRMTLFKDKYFENKQIILACHGEEFFKDIQNLLPVEKAQKIIAISFLPKISQQDLNIDRHCSPRNYIIAARAHYNKAEIRDSLDKSRKALEALVKGNLWKYVNKHCGEALSIKLRSPKDPIELRNLTEQLKSKIAKSAFPDQDKNNVLDPLNEILGIDGTSREWRYLNKGTHEEADRENFDRQTVNRIIMVLEKLDKTLK